MATENTSPVRGGGTWRAMDGSAAPSGLESIFVTTLSGGSQSLTPGYNPSPLRGWACSDYNPSLLRGSVCSGYNASLRRGWVGVEMASVKPLLS